MEKSPEKEKSDQKLFTTRTHHALANNLMRKTRRPQAGEYIGHNGVPGRLIQGPQGVGKSTVLTTFAAQCPTLFPDVIPVYVSFDDLENPQTLLRSKTVLRVVEDQLLAKGVPVARRNADDPVDREALAKALEDAKKFVVLMVDEIDKAYRVTDEPLRGIVLSSLYELSWLGGQRTGRFVVYLCGSSSSGPLLLTCQASKDEFPRQHGAPHLNATKFQTFRLPISRFDDVDTVEQLLVDVLGKKASSLEGCATKQLARLIGFAAGVVPRSIANAIESLEDEPDSALMDQDRTRHLSGQQAAESLAIPLYEALLLEMRTKNRRSFLDVISTDGGLDIEKLLSEMNFPSAISTLILFGLVLGLGSVVFGQDLNISPDASILFQSTTANGRPPQCELLRREPRSPSAFFTNILTKPENTTVRFPQTAAALDRDTKSMGVMISLIVDDRSLPTARSYVNVLLTNRDGDQFWLSQNFRTTTPFLKTIVSSANALSVNAVQLNLMLPMTGLPYSTGPQMAQQTAFLPAGDYVVEVQLVRAPSKGKGGGRTRNGLWQKLPSLGTGNALDQATLRSGDNVVGCARLDNLFAVSPILVDHRVTDSMPLILNPLTQETVWFEQRPGSYDAPLFTPKPMFVVVTEAPWFMAAGPMAAAAAEEEGVHRPVQYENATLTPLFRVSDVSGGSCGLDMDTTATVPLLLLSSAVAMVTLPAMEPACGDVQFRLRYVFPDRRHRLVVDFFATTPLAFDGALALASAMNGDDGGGGARRNETERLIAGLTAVLDETQSTLLPRHVVQANDSDTATDTDADTDTVREMVLAVTDTATMVALRALWIRRVDASNLTQLWASALAEARSTLAQVAPFTSEGASNSSSYLYHDTVVDADDFFAGDDAYFGQNVSSSRRLSLSSSESESCAMGVFVDVIDALSTAFVKLQRSMVAVRASVVQLQVARQQRPAAVTVAALVQQLRAEFDVSGVVSLPAPLVAPLVRLYAQVVVLGALATHVERLTLRLATMRASGCLVPCLQATATTTAAVPAAASCDTFVELPLTKELEPFSTNARGCAAQWYPLAMQRLNVFANGSARISVGDMDALLPSSSTVTTEWAATVASLALAHRPWAHDERFVVPVRGDEVARVVSLSTFQPQLPMRTTPAIARPPRLYLVHDNDYRVHDHVNDTAAAVALPIVGRYDRSPVAGFEDAYEHEEHAYRLVLRRGRASCPKGEWGVVPAADSAWKKYADPSRPWNNATDTVVAQFADCFFHSHAEKQAFSVAQSYNASALRPVTVGYRVLFHDP
eukprot:gene4677-3354_t